MKLAFLNDSIFKYASGGSSAVGGAERQQWLLARALAASGWAVTVGVREGLEAGTRKVVDSVQFAGIGRGYGHILSAWYRFLLSERPTWWYWRCASHLLGPAVAMAKLVGVRTIFSTALDPEVNPRHALCDRARWWPLYAWGLSWSDRIFLQHRGQLAGLAANLRPKSYVVPSIAGETTAVKSHSERTKYIAWVAQLRQPKRPDLLIEIARKSPALHFIVCGGPSTFMSPPGHSERIIEALRRLPNIEYRGQVSPQDALQVIADAAVLLSTADEEGFPNTFLQAWSAGTPVISLKVDPDHIIKRLGLGVISRSVEGTLSAIHALIDSPQRREDIAIRALRYVTDNHSEKAVIAAFERAIGGESEINQQPLLCNPPE
jgi:glycosyltransferase involved in cell wall biosynthesis